MHPWATNISTRTLNVRRFGFEPRVRLGPLTNTQGLPPNRLPILASQGPGMHAPLGNVLRVELGGAAHYINHRGTRFAYSCH